ncbi:MAG: sulfotransferase domain-containing protein [Gemmatimonadaceae bacterium]
MAWLWWILASLGIFVVLFLIQGIYLSTVLKWEDEQTIGLKYYGLPLAGREGFKRTLRRHAKLLRPILWMNAQSVKLDFRKARIQYKGISAPTGSCSVESFAKAEAYQPRPEDIFVATQMKCGTTWMQHIVFQILYRGNGDLVETGREMYAVAPWIEGRKSVPMEQAPLLGAERPSRIIKTHLPAQLCPFSPNARYIYAARHPISCFASCIDFVVTNVGAMAPGLPQFEEWYTTADVMWWGTWTNHVTGWWDRAQQEQNVLFVYFEDMKKDLPGIVRRVAAFLGVPPLSDQELANVVHKCGFKYMQEHQDNFEMHPPHILQSDAELFVSGSADRHKDVPEDVRRRIAAWTVKEMSESSFPLPKMYPDVVALGAPAA